MKGSRRKLEPVTDEMNRDGRRILLPLLGAAALVLLIACGNAAALLLVRGLQRQQEYAVRSAMGMGRMALLRQVLMESLLLALLGGAIGVGLAFGAVKLFKVIAGHAVPRLDGVTAGWAVLGWGLGVAVLAAFFAAVIPGAASVSVGSDGGAEERRAERNGGNRREAVAAGSHDAADGADVGAAGGRGAADSHHGENRAGAVGLQHGSNIDDERDGGAKPVELGQLSPAGVGTRCRDSGRAVRGVCLGSAADRKQLAGDFGH